MEESVSLTFSEINSFSTILEERIPDDATCISVKVNIPDYDPSDNNYVYPCYSDVLAYFKDCGVEIIAVSSGLHLNGRNQIPHIHYHFVTNHYNAPSNPSQHRKRWLAKEGNEERNLYDASFKYQRLRANEPKYQFLSYPLKEGRLLNRRYYYMYDGDLMSTEMVNFLLEVGKKIYDQQVALHLRQAKCQERKQLALRELYDLVHAIPFSNFKQMMTWLDDNYISTLDLEEMPDPKNYKTNCQKIAVKLGILKYSDI